MASNGGCRAFLAAVTFLALCFSCARGAIQANGYLVVEAAGRQLDLSTQVVVLSETIRITNRGEKATAGVLVCTSSKLAARRSFFEVVEVQDGKAPSDYPVLQTNEVKVSGMPSGAVCHAAILDTVLKSGETVTLESYAAHTRLLEASPPTVSYQDSQQMLFEDEAALLLMSPYRVGNQNLEVKLPEGPGAATYTDMEPVLKLPHAIQYGPMLDERPWAFEPLRVHFDTSVPFLEVPRLEREISVSAWGRIHVEETYQLRHGGAEFVGEWKGKLEDGPNSLHPGIEAVMATLPGDATGVYFRDDYGNISSSRLYSLNGKVEVILVPRYPLLGGWKTTFVLGYDLPMESHVERLSPAASWWSSLVSGDRLRLKALLGCPIQQAVVEELQVKVVLPEGSVDIKPSLPFPGRASTSSETRRSSFGTVGKPVLAIRMTNLVYEHNREFSVNFRLSPASVARQPLLIATAFLAVFGGIMASSRLGGAQLTNKTKEAKKAASGGGKADEPSPGAKKSVKGKENQAPPAAEAESPSNIVSPLSEKNGAGGGPQRRRAATAN